MIRGGLEVNRVRSSALLSALLGTLLLFFFQNCANQPLEKIEKTSVSAYEAPLLNLKSEFCPKSVAGSAGSSKFIFIVDLSASNFGNWKKESVSGVNYFYWDPSQGTDSLGARFEAIKTFVNTCGSTESSSFSLIGFSATAGTLTSTTLNCENPQFINKNQLVSQLDALKARQGEDQKWYEKWIFPNFLKEPTPDKLIYRVTSYTSAMTCLEDTLLKDLNTDSAADRYNVFFISDGKPEDKANTGCNLSSMTPEQKEACYLDSVYDHLTFTKTASLSKGKSFALGGIYYGTGETPKVLEKISMEGGIPEVTRIDSFQSDQNAICKLVVTQFSTEFRPDSYVMVPLTTVRKNGVLQPDSDMDGLTDDEEFKLGSDPKNPRSIVPGVLDGICQKLGGSIPCAEKRQQVNCNPSLQNLAYLTDCDFKVSDLNLVGTPGDWGVDTDHDGLLDYLEIIKGLNPSKSDTLLDPDGDGISNKEEIMRGTDPFTPDSELSVSILNQIMNGFDYDPSNSDCPLGAYSVGLSRMQVTPVLETPLHAANEHLVLIQVRYLPINSLEVKREYYGSIIPVQLKNEESIEILSPQIDKVPQSSLIKMGVCGE